MAAGATSRAVTPAEGPDLSYSSAPGRWVLAVTVLGSGIAALDATVVSIALPTIGRDFHASAYLHPDALAAGFRTAVLISGALCAAGGLLAAVTITNPARGHRPAGAAVPDQCLHCGLDAPPLTTSVSPRE
jgi:hypothetical protein